MGYSISTPKSINTERMLQDNTINKQWNESRRYILWRVSNENQTEEDQYDREKIGERNSSNITVRWPSLHH